MVNKVKSYIEKNKMISPGDSIVVGVSGGADSLCLLFMLKEIYGDKLSLKVVHINHGLRENAVKEAEYVKKICEEQGIAVSVVNADVKAIAKENKMTEEEAGRFIRYEAFQKEASDRCLIAVAHTINDNAETVLLNIFRGSSLKGLTGISAVNGNIIRPLLCLTRKETEQYLINRGIEFCLDESNDTDEYARNRVRHNIIPFVEKSINEGVINNIYRLSESLEEAEEYLDIQEQELAAKVIQESERIISIKESEFTNLHSYMKKRIVYRAIAKAAGKKKDIEKIHVDELVNLFSKQTGKSICLPYGLTAKRTYNGVQIIKEYQEKTFDLEEIELGETININGFTLKSKVFDYNGNENIAKEKYTKWFDYDKIKNTAVLRYRKEGDYIVINPKGDKQKLKKFFINEKVPSEVRNNVPLICDGSSVVWVVGYKMSEQYYITSSTKRVIEISIEHSI